MAGFKRITDRPLPPNHPIIVALHARAITVDQGRTKQIRRNSLVWQRLKGRCFYCGEPASVLDHILPRCAGGTNHHKNLIPACWECNQEKGGKLIDHFRWYCARRDGICADFTRSQITFLAYQWKKFKLTASISDFLFTDLNSYVFWGEMHL